MTRIAWGGYPKVSEESTAYHAWIITPTADGCHVWTEETMRGPHWLELAKHAPDAFWLTHGSCSRISPRSRWPASIRAANFP